MPAHASEIDETVLKLRSNLAHTFEYVMIDGVSVRLCTRCCRREADVSADNLARPCRGFPG
jgi:hypothetical protein